MKSILSKHRYRGLGIFTILIFAFTNLGAQQITNPTLDTFQSDPALPSTAVAYVGLKNLTNTGLFNFITTVSPDIPLQSFSSGFLCKVTTDYFDGLGRPLQTVAQKAYAEGNDIVQTHMYDNRGLETYQYLPFAAPTQNYYIAGYSPVGKIKLNDSTQLRGFYEADGHHDEQPFSQTVFENSPLNRVVKQMAPGTSWVGSGRGITYDYKTNTQYWPYSTSLGSYALAGAFPRWTISAQANALPVVSGYYDAGQLSLTSVTDEDGKNAIEAKDKQGRVVMKLAGRGVSLNGQMRPMDYAYTFYVYDDIGNLRCVIPPAVNPTPSGTNGSISWGPLTLDQMNGLCYTYFYDERNRLVEKKLPGSDIEYFVYDKRDRLVFHQDGNLRHQGKWMYSFYDALDRPTVTGLNTDNPSRIDLQNAINQLAGWNNPNDYWYYVQNYNLFDVYPPDNTLFKVLSYNYYDDYLQLTQFTYDGYQFNTVPSSPNGAYSVPAKSTLTRGLQTGGRTRVIDPDNPNSNNWLAYVNYYDDKGRLIQTQSKNINGGTDYSSNIYNFQGTLFKNIIQHNNPIAKPTPGTTLPPDTIIRIYKTITRNIHSGGGNDLVSNITYQIQDSGIVYPFANYFYDHLGRNVVKQTPAADTRNDYTMNGKLNHIQVQNFNNAVLYPTYDPQIFEEWLYYDRGFNNKFYNGNIAGIKWTMQGLNAPPQTYGYSYDSLNRLTHAEYRTKHPGGNSWNNTATDYTAWGITYDYNGNIKTMNQRGVDPGNPTSPIDMDKLSYNYTANTNQLKSVEDIAPSASALPDFKNGASQSTEYTFDANGNMITDANKGCTYQYNIFNKPVTITVDGKGTITYIYDAVGNLLQKKVSPLNNGPAEKWDYIGDFVYKNDTLQYISNEEGRARPVPTPWGQNDIKTKYVYDYFVKDHLGNVRSTITANPINSNYLAGFEMSQANIEQLVFDNVAPVRDQKPGSTDPDDHMSARLNANDPNTTIGTSIMLKTMPGDRFNISVDALYEGDYQQRDIITGRDIVSGLLTTLTGGINYDGIPTSELPDNVKTIQTIFNNPNLAGQIDQLTSNSNNMAAPRAHLNYLFFDKNMQLVSESSGAVQVGAGAQGWNHLTTGGSGSAQPVPICASCVLGTGNEVIAPGGGFLVVYIDNQSIGKDVWFDHFMIEHYTSEVLEEDHYYPFGLTLSLDQNQNVTLNTKKYQSIELEKHFGLEQYETINRTLDPQLGLFKQPDSKAENHYNVSPYASMGNNPALNVDPLGDDWFVNNTSGSVVYVKDATSASTESFKGAGFSGNSNDYQRLGSNTMFGNKLNDSKGNSVLDKNLFVVGNSEAFMKGEGYSKAEEVKIEEARYTVSGGFGGEEQITQTHADLQQIGASKITYVKPALLDKKEVLSEKTSSQGRSSIDRTVYNLTKPFGQDNHKTARYYENISDAKANAGNGASFFSSVGKAIKAFFKH